MAEYIDRQAAIALAKDIIVPTKNGYGYRHRCIDPQDLAELPAADVVERKTGRWLKVNGYAIALVSDGETITMPTHKCSACGDSSLNVFYTNYCPKCGAKMIGGDDDV